jgi:hypothetical protein
VAWGLAVFMWTRSPAVESPSVDSLMETGWDSAVGPARSPQPAGSTGRNPFRLFSRAEPPDPNDQIGYSPPEDSGLVAQLDQEFRLKGIVGGPPWIVIIGPRHEPGSDLVLRIGESVGEWTLATVSGDSAHFQSQSGDSAVVLYLEAAR